MDPSQPPQTLGRSRGRGRALYQHPEDPQRQRTPWSLAEGGPRPRVPTVSRTALGVKTTTTSSDELQGRRGLSIKLRQPLSTQEASTTANLGRGQPVVLPQATGSDPSKKIVYPEARPTPSDLDQQRRVARETFVRTRPKQIVSKTGTDGQKLTCEANYFRLKKSPSWNIYLHRIDFEPDILLDQTRRKLIFSISDMFESGYLFDGTQLFLTKKLEDAAGPIERTITSDDGSSVKIIIKFVGVTEMQEERATQILNLIVRKAMDGLRLQTIGRNKFDAAAKELVRNLKLEVWPGYITSIRQHENDILLCAELTSKVMRADTVHDILQKLLAESRGDFRTAAEKALLGTTVLTDYNNRTYRIDDILFDKSPRDTFDSADGREISYIDYYKKYGKTIKDLNQPLLVSHLKEKDVRAGQKKDIFLIPELCRATGLTDDMRSNFRTMKELGQYTKIGPGMRMERLLAFNRRLNDSAESRGVLDRWNLELDRELIKIPARLLPFPKLVFGANKTVELVNKTDWTSEFRNGKMFLTIDMKRWILIYPARAKMEAQQFIQALQQAGRGMNFNIESPKIQEIPNDNQLTIGNELVTAKNLNPQLIMCIVSNNNADRYATIKKRCYIEYGVPSQVIVHKTITPKDKARAVSGLLSVATKVAIQMNAKLGGIPWMIEVPISGLMTVGYDVCHDPKDKRASWGAMVATMDLKKRNNEFFSTVNRHDKNQEMSDHLAANMAKALMKFHQINGCLPSRVLFFRDGVGDGQIGHVYNQELVAIRDQMKHVYMNMGIQDEIKFTYIIVTKRINTRIFFNKKNPDPGTCVDDIITLPERYDFFIVPQTVREGTVSPTGFNVIHDTMGLPPDRLQQLTFRFTFFYFNWSGTVKVPALCQYAHKLAFIASNSLQASANIKLDNTLYYL